MLLIQILITLQSMNRSTSRPGGRVLERGGAPAEHGADAPAPGHTLKGMYRTVHTGSALWTILAFKMRKWFPNIFESLYLHITSDLIELYVYK